MFWRSPSTTSWASELAAKTRHHRIIEDAASGEYHASVADNRGVQPMAAFDAKKLSQLDWVIAGAGAVALIALFLPREGWTDGPFSASASGWSTGFGWLGVLLVIAAAVYLVLLRSDANMPRLPVGPAVAVLGAASLGALIIILRWLTLPSGSVAGTAVSWGPRIGLFLALLAALAQVACAFLTFRGSGEVLPWAGQSSPSQGVGTPPPGGFTAPSAGFMPMAGSPESPITESGLPDDDGTSPAI